MTRSSILELLAQVERGELKANDAAERLATLPYEDIGHTRIDHHRSLRSGLPEVIYARGKSPQQTAAIFERLATSGVDVIATHADELTAELVLKSHPQARYHVVPKLLTLRQTAIAAQCGHIAVVCAGTSDLPAAEEAAIVAETFGAQVSRFYDVGVAGLHRLLGVNEKLREAHVVIVCAGMEGALPSVVGGLVAVPVIAVPTSVGYGASFGGAAALLGMLNSCSPNVSVVNIDNGFGAAYIATLIARASAR